jgi:hypothetical protein
VRERVSESEGAERERVRESERGPGAYIGRVNVAAGGLVARRYYFNLAAGSITARRYLCHIQIAAGCIPARCYL